MDNNKTPPHGTQSGSSDSVLPNLSFSEWLRIYRMKAQLTQKELAERAGVAEATIGDLERGINKRPRSDTLEKLLDALYLTPEDRKILEKAGRRRNYSATSPKRGGQTVRDIPRDDTSHNADGGRVEIMYRDWPDEPDRSALFSRSEELATLKRWIVDDRCRVVATIGLRGIGKTNLTTAFAQGGDDAPFGRDLAQRFDYVFWRSLISAPRLEDILRQVIVFVSDQGAIDLPESIDERLKMLFSYLHERRCLVILDNAETILRGGNDVGHYQSGYEDYGRLIRQFAELPHQSCLLLTSREKPVEVAQMETWTGALRVLSLSGIDAAGCRRIFAQIDNTFSGSDSDWEYLTRQYEGSPLALNLVARHIRDTYGGNVTAFLRAPSLLIKDLEGLLEWYFERISSLQKELLYWLAISREPVSLDELLVLLLSKQSQHELPSTLQALLRLLPIQRTSAGFTLQPVLIEYMTARLIEQMTLEIAEEHIALLNTHAVMLALAKDYIRDTQRRVFLNPILQALAEQVGPSLREQKLQRLLGILRQHPPTLRGYAAGNIINLMLLLGMDLRGQDFSCQHIRQAYLREASLIAVNFADAVFEQSAFTDVFGNVLSVAFSPEPIGQALIAAGTGSGDIRLWRAGDSMPLATFAGHTDWVWGLAFSPSGRLLASGSSDQTIRLWDVSSGKHMFILRGHSNRVRSVTFSHDGRLLASASEDGTVGLWDVSSGALIRYFKGHAHPVREVAFTPDSKTLASCSDDQTIRVWDVETGGERYQPLKGHERQIWSLAISPDGRTIASGGDDLVVRLWDVATGHKIAALEGHTGWICSLAFSPDGAHLASASADTTLRLWSLETHESVRVLQGHSNWVNSVRFHQDGIVVASGSHDQTVRLWETASGNRIATMQGYSNGIRAVAFGSSGKILATADRTVHLWNVESGESKTVLSGHSAVIRTLAISNDEQYVASGSDDRLSLVWSLPSGRVGPYRKFSGHSNRVKSVVFSPDGTLVATGSDDNTVRLWEVETQRPRLLEGHTNRIRALAFNRSGLLVGSGSDDATARLWDVASAEVVHVLKGHENRIWSIAFSPDGRLFATGSEDKRICLWDTETGTCLHTLLGHTNPVWAIAFRPDGAVLASSSEDQTIRLWDVGSGTCLHVLEGHTKPIWALAFSPDQVRLASGSHDHTVRLWNSYSGRCLATLAGHRDTVWAVTFDPSGTLVASGSDDGSSKIWNVNRKTLLHSLQGERLYEGMNIRGITGVSDAQIITLRALGALEYD